MNYIDTHCHLNFSAYQDDREEVIAQTHHDSVATIVVGTQIDTSKKAIELASKYQSMWAIIGLHPIHTVEQFRDNEELGSEDQTFTSRAETFDTQTYLALARSSDKVIGIGECGFDYYHNNEATKKVQEHAFRAQIECALELDLPLMLHIRPSEGSYDAYEDSLAILREYKTSSSNLRGQAHFFAGNESIAHEFIDLGFFISFTGVITFASEYHKVVKAIPLDRILTETDAPYVSPKPYRGKRNIPSYVKEVYKSIAEIKGIDVEALTKVVKENVNRLYGI